MTFLVHPFVPPDQGGASLAEELGMGIHGGHQETSVFMHLRPDLVHLERASRAVPEGLVRNRYVRFGGLATFGWLSSDFRSHGHVGAPTGASRELDRQLVEMAAVLLGEQWAEIAAFDFGGGVV